MAVAAGTVMMVAVVVGVVMMIMAMMIVRVVVIVRHGVFSHQGRGGSIFARPAPALYRPAASNRK
jgi:hypothetical protein